MKLPPDISGAKAIQALERLSFAITRQTGSHVRMARGNRRVTVPMQRDLVVCTLQSILLTITVWELEASASGSLSTSITA